MSYSLRFPQLRGFFTSPHEFSDLVLLSVKFYNLLPLDAKLLPLLCIALPPLRVAHCTEFIYLQVGSGLDTVGTLAWPGNSLTTGIQPDDAFLLGFDSAHCRRTPGNRVRPHKPCSLSSTARSTPSSGPHLSLFPPSDPSTVPSQTHAASKITFGINGLSNGGRAVGDPASLGVAPVMLGETSASYTAAGQSEVDYAIDVVPHWINGAISQRVDVAELWCVTFFISHLSHIRWDFIYMLPRFLAYFAADTQNASLLETAYLHCGLYHSVLLFSSNTSDAAFRPPFTSPTHGSWHHIIGPKAPSWACGARAPAGRPRTWRVLATVLNAPVALNTTWRKSAITDRTAWIREIVDGARGAPMDSGLLRNYLSDTTTGHGFGQISGSALITAMAYHMVVLAPEAFPAASDARGERARVVGYGAVDGGEVPEGNNFVVLLYAAWMDCSTARSADALRGIGYGLTSPARARLPALLRLWARTFPCSHPPILRRFHPRCTPQITLGINGLSNGSGAVGDPASLGVAAVMLPGRLNASYTAVDYAVDAAPRWINCAISQNADVTEVWADFIYMLPPFLAYFAADTQNASLLETAYLQCGLYRSVLLFSSNTSDTAFLLHSLRPPTAAGTTVGPQSAEPGLWSTGNGWAAAGMARVLAAVLKAPVTLNTAGCDTTITDFTPWIQEIVEGARAAPADLGLLRNHPDDTTPGYGFGEISGSALIAAVAYRIVVLTPEAFNADTDAQVNPHVTQNGTATGYGAVDGGESEGNNFVVLYAAWRDCMWTGFFRVGDLIRSPTPTKSLLHVSGRYQNYFMFVLQQSSSLAYRIIYVFHLYLKCEFHRTFRVYNAFLRVIDADPFYALILVRSLMGTGTSGQ
ncbi:hypothetical protein C8R44DRAFT_974264 [Mycena epipterygia]|nr:hypothetical protein C8R44DRAFT_974264 [Mycena epipterygia]